MHSQDTPKQAGLDAPLLETTTHPDEERPVLEAADQAYAIFKHIAEHVAYGEPVPKIVFFTHEGKYLSFDVADGAEFLRKLTMFLVQEVSPDPLGTVEMSEGHNALVPFPIDDNDLREKLLILHIEQSESRV
jgi:hypothetical protein